MQKKGDLVQQNLFMTHHCPNKHTDGSWLSNQQEGFQMQLMQKLFNDNCNHPKQYLHQQQMNLSTQKSLRQNSNWKCDLFVRWCKLNCKCNLPNTHPCQRIIQQIRYWEPTPNPIWGKNVTIAYHYPGFALCTHNLLMVNFPLCMRNLLMETNEYVSGNTSHLNSFLKWVSNNNLLIQTFANNLLHASTYSSFYQSTCSKLATEAIYCSTIIGPLQLIFGWQLPWRTRSLMLQTPRKQQERTILNLTLMNSWLSNDNPSTSPIMLLLIWRLLQFHK